MTAVPVGSSGIAPPRGKSLKVRGAGEAEAHAKGSGWALTKGEMGDVRCGWSTHLNACSRVLAGLAPGADCQLRAPGPKPFDGEWLLLLVCT